MGMVLKSDLCTIGRIKKGGDVPPCYQSAISTNLPSFT